MKAMPPASATVPSASLVDGSKLGAVVGCILGIGGKALYGDPVASIGQDDVQGKQVAKVSHMHPRSAFAFGTVTAGAGAVHWVSSAACGC